MPGGFEKILRGVVKYHNTLKADTKQLLENFKSGVVKPQALFLTCMDARMFPARFTQTDIGEMYILRNAGNIVPKAVTWGNHWTDVSVSTEVAAIELATLKAGMQHTIVCGHSDCKAMHTLYGMHEHPECVCSDSPLDLWLSRGGSSSLVKLEEHLKKKPLTFLENMPARTFTAHIDPEDRLTMQDKLSQINTLQQLEHIISHERLRPSIESGQVKLHALWFDAAAAEVYAFSLKEKQFVKIEENTVEGLVKQMLATM